MSSVMAYCAPARHIEKSMSTQVIRQDGTSSFAFSAFFEKAWPEFYYIEVVEALNKCAE